VDNPASIPLHGHPPEHLGPGKQLVQFPTVYADYLKQYAIDDVLYPFTDRYRQLLFAQLKRQTLIQKELSPKTFRHTHVVRATDEGRVRTWCLIGSGWLLTRAMKHGRYPPGWRGGAYRECVC